MCTLYSIIFFPEMLRGQRRPQRKRKGKRNISLYLSSPSLAFPRPGNWHQVWCAHSKDIGCGVLTVGLLFSLTDWNNFVFTAALPRPSLLADFSFPLPTYLFTYMTLMTNRKMESMECTKLRHLSNSVVRKFSRGTGGGDYSSVTGRRVSWTAAQR